MYTKRDFEDFYERDVYLKEAVDEIIQAIDIKAEDLLLPDFTTSDDNQESCPHFASEIDELMEGIDISIGKLPPLTDYNKLNTETQMQEKDPQLKAFVDEMEFSLDFKDLQLSLEPQINAGGKDPDMAASLDEPESMRQAS